MKTGCLKKIGTSLLLTPALLLSTLPASAQWRGRDDDHRGEYREHYEHRDRDFHGRYYGAPTYAYYGAPAYADYGSSYGYRGDYGYYNHDDGIGPGKGAAIGAVGGAVLGALIGGGKGAVIGGATGAGVGAIAGQAAQDNRRAQYGY